MGFLARLFCFVDPHHAPSAHAVDFDPRVTATASTSKVNEDQLPLPPAPASANKNAKSIPVAETPAARALTVAQTSSTIPPTPVTASAQTATTKRSTPKASTTVKSGANAVIPYTPARSVAIFDEYADEDEPDAIGPEGLERLCDDMGVPMDGPGPFVLAWLLGAKEMGKIAKAEWVKGTDDLQCVSCLSCIDRGSTVAARIASVSALKMVLEEFQDLLMTDKPPVQASAPVAQPAKGKRVSTKTGSSEQYNRTRYLQAAADRRATFAQLYNFCFTMAKPEQSRNLDMDVSNACHFRIGNMVLIMLHSLPRRSGQSSLPRGTPSLPRSSTLSV